MHLLEAHIYIAVHEEANWTSTSLPALKQTSDKVSSFLRLVLFLFPGVLMQQASYQKSLNISCLLLLSLILLPHHFWLTFI